MNLYKLNLEQRIAQRGKIHQEIVDRDKVLISDIIQERFSLEATGRVKILDFGCGQGKMVDHLRTLGYDAYGCDLFPAWEKEQAIPTDRFAVISTTPYRLPYADESFDLVFSTSVFEHTQNPEECFREIRRILKVGGVSMHYFPAKFYLPSEPHIHIPLVNFFWPRCPNWWIGAWLLLRVAYAPKLAPYFKDTYRQYCEFCRTEINYLPNRIYRRLSMEIFGNYGSLLDFYIARANGRYARLARKIPLKKVAIWASSNFRMNFIFQQKLV